MILTLAIKAKHIKSIITTKLITVKFKFIISKSMKKISLFSLTNHSPYVAKKAITDKKSH